MHEPAPADGRVHRIFGVAAAWWAILYAGCDAYER